MQEGYGGRKGEEGESRRKERRESEGRKCGTYSEKSSLSSI